MTVKSVQAELHASPKFVANTFPLSISALPIAANPSYILSYLPFVISATWISWRDGRWRILLYVVTGLMVFGSSSTLSDKKILYGLFLVFVFLTSLAHRRNRGTSTGWRSADSDFNSKLSFLPVIPLCITAVTGPMSGAGAELIRGILLYAMAVIAPTIATAASSRISQADTSRLISALTLFSAAGYALYTLQFRGVLVPGLSSFAVGSLLLPAFGLCFSFARLLAGNLSRPHYINHTVIVAVVLVSLFVTGTRTNLMIFVPMIYILIRNSRNSFGAAVSSIIKFVAALVVAYLSFSWVAQFLISQPGFIQSRIIALMRVVNSGTSADASLILRQSANDYALHAIAQEPLTGQGFNFFPPTLRSFDTPLSTVVEVGLLGASALAVYLVYLFRRLWRISANLSDKNAQVTLEGWAVMVLSYLLVGSPLEDKGFSFGLILLTLMVLTSQRSELESEPRKGASKTGQLNGQSV